MLRKEIILIFVSKNIKRIEVAPDTNKGTPNMNNDIINELEQFDQPTVDALKEAAMRRLGMNEEAAEQYAKDLIVMIINNPNTITEDMETLGARDWVAEHAIIVADSVLKALSEKA